MLPAASAQVPTAATEMFIVKSQHPSHQSETCARLIRGARQAVDASVAGAPVPRARLAGLPAAGLQRRLSIFVRSIHIRICIAIAIIVLPCQRCQATAALQMESEASRDTPAAQLC
jgi:hypothetical protein